MVLGSLLSDAAASTIKKGLNKQRRDKKADTEKQDTVPISGTISVGEGKTYNFEDAPKGSALSKYSPFQSIDCYNATGQPIRIEINEVDTLILPVPDGAQNGDSYEDIGVWKIRVIHDGDAGAADIDLENLNIVASGNPSGIARGSK